MRIVANSEKMSQIRVSRGHTQIIAILHRGGGPLKQDPVSTMQKTGYDSSFFGLEKGFTYGCGC